MTAPLRLAALLSAGILALSACGEPPPEEENGDDNGDGEAAESIDFEACMVTDDGGIDDRSFNATSWKGLTDAESELGIDAKYVESNSQSDYTPNLNELVRDDCDLIVAVGGLMGTDVVEIAEQNPDQNFVHVDGEPSDATDNLKPLAYQTQQAAFLAGHLAAGMTETDAVATWGGEKIPQVTIFMDGFADGVENYNETHDTDVDLLGWDKDSQDGRFTDSFAQGPGKQLTANLLQQGADIVMPVAGPAGLDAAQAVREAGSGSIVWVDSDGYEFAPDFSDLFVTSVLKKMDVSVYEAIEATVDESFDGEPFIGTVDNDAVGLASYHDFADEVPPELQDEIEELTEQIISGELIVDSDAAPQD